jgi:hypothetical protein
MLSRRRLSSVAGVFLLLTSTACRYQPPPAPPAPAPSASAADVDVVALQAEVTRLKGVAPSASVAMADVGFHFTNLWFAGQRGNWPLANYYFSEARNRPRRGVAEIVSGRTILGGSIRSA